MLKPVKKVFRIRVTDAKDVWQEGRRTAFFVRDAQVPTELVLDYKENALYLPAILLERVWIDEQNLNLFFKWLDVPLLRLPLDSVIEYGPVEIFRS